MFLVIFSSHDLPTTEKVLKFMQMRAWYINLRSAVWVVGTESPRLTARWPNVTLEHAVVAFLQSLQKMTLKELLGLALGGTGGRGGPSASEDQGAENAWNNIGALESLISPSRRRSSHGPASWDIIAKIETGDQVTKPARKSKQSASGGAGRVATATGCKCGSTTHLRTSHSACPLSKKNLAARPAK